ncbi:helix-turn-helix transcriptional regulator [Paractinoplanes globisporus]|uniref:LuxR C-terminal-related transcriptional regulator n=1 Tax=Paractinoplanes globisporus TaxID=113565 RepID=A0ABW6WWN9_9ACTN|nr:helix-turn-helix transcriptional regulator [Actinoplanes globisporus]
METGTVRRELARLVRRGLDPPAFVRSAVRVLRRSVPADGTCVISTDPATLLPVGEVVDHGLPAEALPRLNEIELREEDFNKFHGLAEAPVSAASLSAATGGDLERSLRQRELRRPSGFADELRAVCRDATGTWGALTLLRETGRPMFTDDDVRLIDVLSPLLAEGLRRSAMLAAASQPETVSQPADEVGLLLLAGDNSVETTNRAADRWLGLWGADAEALPMAVQSTANQARAGGSEMSVARARVRTPDGTWLVVRGSLLGDGPRVAVLLEPARPAELAPMIADAYGLTEREQRVTELVARGYSTARIADRLHLSAYTVQDHLKSIFEKSGTSSRGDLVARLYIDHYGPH